jgi:ketosteroid isomerase-like protein
MSEEKVAVIRRLEAAFNERDLQRVLTAMHPDVELELIGGFADIMGQSTFNGAEGVRRFFADWYATFKTVRTEQERAFEVGNDRILVLSRFRATVEGSDLPVELPIGSIFTFEDEKVIRVAAYYDRKDALEAAGLSEQDAYAES